MLAQCHLIYFLHLHLGCGLLIYCETFILENSSENRSFLFLYDWLTFSLKDKQTSEIWLEIVTLPCDSRWFYSPSGSYERKLHNFIEKNKFNKKISRHLTFVCIRQEITWNWGSQDRLPWRDNIKRTIELASILPSWAQPMSYRTICFLKMSRPQALFILS